MFRRKVSLRTELRKVFGSPAALKSRRASRWRAAHPEAGVRAFLQLAATGDQACDARPIFIFSAGWRSGSTLLQRLVCSSDKVLLWGEPYDQVRVVQMMAQSLAPFCADWPPPAYYNELTDLGDVSQRWIANLYPKPEAVLKGYRCLLEESFAKPAETSGAERWGLKEVRFGLAEAILLKGLFPSARFLFIQRDLVDAYLSYRSFSVRQDWYANWPHGQAATVYGFARHWRRLSEEFPEAVSETGGMLIDYDRLVTGALPVQDIADYLDISINPEVLEQRVGQGARRAAAQLSPLERMQLWLGQNPRLKKR